MEFDIKFKVYLLLLGAVTAVVRSERVQKRDANSSIISVEEIQPHVERANFPVIDPRVFPGGGYAMVILTAVMARMKSQRTVQLKELQEDPVKQVSSSVRTAIAFPRPGDVIRLTIAEITLMRKGVNQNVPMKNSSVRAIISVSQQPGDVMDFKIVKMAQMR
ncbi:hypothetical protein SK128_005538 [Halocaridina rubra]|uniref:Uncharacterized protein n=1 Tax=Halocaridina rubra TaxID=373956 RepID=A0AAN9A7L9_HALRR